LRRFAHAPDAELVVVDARDLDVDVDAVQQRSRDAFLIFSDGWRRSRCRASAGRRSSRTGKDIYNCTFFALVSLETRAISAMERNERLTD
jgi:hypothetical protein